MTIPEQPAIDWRSIEVEYRAGLKSLRLIGEQHGVSHVTIFKRAKTQKWQRDLSSKVKAREEELVNTALVNNTVNRKELVARKNAEDRHVEQLAFTKATVRLDHASKIRRSMNLFMAMLGDLEVISNPEGQGLIEALMDAALTPDNEIPDEARKRRQKQSELLAKVLNIPGRIDSGKRLVDMLERLVTMERQAYGINDKDQVEEHTSMQLSDAERASRAAQIISMALQRQAVAKTAQTAQLPPFAPDRG